MSSRIRWFNTVGMADIGVVSGKNTSLGEMIPHLQSLGVAVPDGFATTASVYRDLLAVDDLGGRIATRLKSLDVTDIEALQEAGREIRGWMAENPLPIAVEASIREAYHELAAGNQMAAVAVRSSATAEDLPDASFAGQQESFLNVRGVDAVFGAIRRVFASLYNDRAIAYREHRGYRHEDVAISAGVQRMVEAEASGVAFTMDTESGFDGVVFITASYGLGELLVQGAVDPDEFYVYKRNLAAQRPAVISRRLGSKSLKMIYGDTMAVDTVAVAAEEQVRFSLTTEEAETLARYAVAVENHYGRPMDLEWAKDSADGRIYLLQARPETVLSRESQRVLDRYSLLEQAVPVVTGRSIGQRIGTGTVRIVRDAGEMDRVREGDVLVADMTDPDWEPVMKRAAAIVTNRGGRTCHAAIIARELEIPAVVGTGRATSLLEDGSVVTVSCADGDDGNVYLGAVAFERKTVLLDAMPEPPTKVMMNVASPSRAFAFSRLPNHGVGLARMEFIINSAIGVHPRALLDYPDVSEPVRSAIETRTVGYAAPADYFIDRLTEGIATIAAAFYPKPVIVRLSDFKSNEYRHLLGGDVYEPVEENPMMGLRGAARFTSPAFAEAFGLECRALRAVRDDFALDNVELMIPFVRTVAELSGVLQVLAGHGLERGRNGLRVIMMCEIPSNALLADQFLDLVDGFSIGSNDLTQLTLALDRDSELVAPLFDERDPAVKELIAMAVEACLRRGKYIGICGQGPSDFPDFASWLVDIGVESVSLNPDTVVETWIHLAETSAKQ